MPPRLAGMLLALCTAELWSDANRLWLGQPEPAAAAEGGRSVVMRGAGLGFGVAAEEEELERVDTLHTDQRAAERIASDLMGRRVGSAASAAAAAAAAGTLADDTELTGGASPPARQPATLRRAACPPPYRCAR